MISVGCIENLSRNRFVAFPVVIQVISIDFRSDRRQKVKISDSLHYIEAYIPIHNKSLQPINNLTLFKLHSVNIKETYAGNLIELIDYEFLQNQQLVIGNPRSFYMQKDTDIIDPSSFCIIQCVLCKNVISHTGYLIENLLFNYVTNSRVNSAMMLVCDCGCELGQKSCYYSLNANKIAVTIFPKQILQGFDSFCRSFDRSFEAIEEIKNNNEELLKNYAKRIEDVEKAVVDLNEVVSQMSRKCFKKTF